MKIKITRVDSFYTPVLIKDIPCGHFFLYNDYVYMKKTSYLIPNSHVECFKFSSSKEAYTELLDVRLAVELCEITRIEYCLMRN